MLHVGCRMFFILFTFVHWHVENEIYVSKSKVL